MLNDFCKIESLKENLNFFEKTEENKKFPNFAGRI